MVVIESQSLSDAEVVGRVRGGETALYELLMRRHNQRLFRVIRSVVASDTEAEDVLQDAWVRAFEHLGQFEGRASFATWATRIAFFEALSRVRKSKRWTALEDEEGEIMREAIPREDAAPSPESQAISGELGRIVQSAIEELPYGYRSVFVLREVEQLSTIETAESLGLSEEAVKTRLHRSRAMLRRALEGQLGQTVTSAYAFLGPRCDRTVAAVLQRLGVSESSASRLP